MIAICLDSSTKFYCGSVVAVLHFILVNIFAFTVLYPWSLFALHILVPVLAGRSHRIMYRSKIHRLESCSFIKKETQAQVFSCKFYEISKTTFLTEHLRTTASACSGLYFCF